MHSLLTQNDLKDMITALRAKYAAQFNKNFPPEGKNAIPMFRVEEELAKSLMGVTPQQFRRGLALLYGTTNVFMPSFADIKTMCMGEDWWNTEKAWIKACEYTKIMEHKPTELPDGTFQFREITTLAKFALDQVMHYIFDGEMYRAKDEFKRLYEAYVLEAQIKGRVQDWYQEKPSLTWNEEKKEHVPVENQEAQKHLESLKKKLNVKNREVHKPKKFEPKAKQAPVDTYWPDPFDNPEGYLQKCAVDGVKVPVEIRRQFGGEA